MPVLARSASALAGRALITSATDGRSRLRDDCEAIDLYSNPFVGYRWHLGMILFREPITRVQQEFGYNEIWVPKIALRLGKQAVDRQHRRSTTNRSPFRTAYYRAVANSQQRWFEPYLSGEVEAEAVDVRANAILVDPSLHPSTASRRERVEKSLAVGKTFRPVCSNSRARPLRFTRWNGIATCLGVALQVIVNASQPDESWAEPVAPYQSHRISDNLPARYTGKAVRKRV